MRHLLIYPRQTFYKGDNADEKDTCNLVNEFDTTKTLKKQASPINTFKEFYKMGLSLPVIEENI